MVALLDANVLLRHVLQDHDEFSPRASGLIRRIEDGDVRVRVLDVTLFETVWTLQRRAGVARSAIRDSLVPIIELPGVTMQNKFVWRRVFEIYVVGGGISFADAIHVATLERLGETEIISFDKDFDRVPGITRREP